MAIEVYYSGGEVPVRVDSARLLDGVQLRAELGEVASLVGKFVDVMTPSDTDSPEVAIAKDVLRWSALVTGAAAVAVVVL